MAPFDELQREHERLLEKAEAADIAEVIAYIDRARALSAQVGDPRERDQLRANLRYWASYAYDRNGTYPTTTLLPAAIAKSIAPPPIPEPKIEEVVPAPRPMWPWLIGAVTVAVVVIAALASQFALGSPAPGPTNSSTTQAGAGTTRWPLSATTDLYDKPGSDDTAQVLGRIQAGSEFYAVARTADDRWLKITTVDAVNGWITAAGSGVTEAAFRQLPVAAIVIASTSTPTATPTPPSTATVTPFSSATAVASAGDEPTATAPPPTPTRAVLLLTPTRAGQKPATPAGPEPPSNTLPLQVNYQVVTYGPSPFNAEAWVIEIQLTATGGDNRYVFWADGQRLAGDRYTLDGAACRAAAFTIGATSGGQAVRREVTLKSPLAKCQ